MSLVPLPEIRELVAVATDFVHGNIHFSYVVTSTTDCVFWAKVHQVAPAIHEFILDWNCLGHRVWPEFPQLISGTCHRCKDGGAHLTPEEYRKLLAVDLGISFDSQSTNYLSSRL